MRKVRFWKNKLYSVGNSRENVKSVVKLGTRKSQSKNRLNHNDGNNGNGTGACNVANRTMTKSVASGLRRRKLKMAVPVISTVTLTGEPMSHKM
jgi:hypothetical protein